MLKLHVKPKKGTAIFWYNLFDSGIGDIRMLHGSCEVVEGIKWSELVEEIELLLIP